MAIEEVWSGYSPTETRAFALQASHGAPFESRKPVIAGYIDPDRLSIPLPEEYWVADDVPVVGFCYGAAERSRLPRPLAHLRPLLKEMFEIENERSGSDKIYVQIEQFSARTPHIEAKPMHLDFGVSTKAGQQMLYFVEALYTVSDRRQTTIFAIGQSSGVQVPSPRVVGEPYAHRKHFMDRVLSTFTFDRIYQPKPGEVTLGNGLHQAPAIEDEEARTLLRIYPARPHKEYGLLPRYADGEVGRAALRAYALERAV